MADLATFENNKLKLVLANSSLTSRVCTRNINLYIIIRRL